jgi:SNF2 family DNA or RNA helicase
VTRNAQVGAGGWQRSSAKVDELMVLLRHLRGGQHAGSPLMEKVVVFSQWTSMLDLLEVPLHRER